MRYRDANGNIYSADELNNLPPEESLAQKFVKFAGRNIEGTQNYEAAAQSLAASYQAHSANNPDNEGRLNEAARILDIPPSAMAGADKEIMSAAQEVSRMKINSPDDWNYFVQEYPKTASYLSNGQNMAMSHDDIMSLGETERTIVNTGKLDDLSRRRSEIGLRLQGEGLSLDSLSDAERNELNSIEQDIKTLSSQLPQTTWSKQGLLSGIIGMVEPAVTGAKYAAGGALAGSVIPGIGTLSGAGYGFRVGMAKDFATTAMGNAYVDNLQQKAANPLLGAYATGLGTAALGSVQVGKWLKIPETPGLKNLTLSTAEQALLGAGFAATDIAGKKIAQNQFNVNADDLTNIGKGATEMIPIGLAMSAAGYGIAGLKRLGQLADESKTAKRAPDVFTDKINSDVEGTTLANVSISGEGLANYLKEVSANNPEDAQKIINKLGITSDSLVEAVATGGYAQIKAGNFATLEKSVRDSLLNDVKVGSEPTAREIEQRIKEFNEISKSINATAEQTKEPRPNTLVEDIGLNNVDTYAKLSKQSESIKEGILKDRNIIERTAEYKEKIKKIAKQVEDEISNDPVYRASDTFKMDLQLFSGKDAREIAEDYRNGKLTDEQTARFEDVAEENGMIGDKLAQKIIKEPAKEDAIKTRISQEVEKYKVSELGSAEEVPYRAELNDNNLQQIAMQAESLRGMSKGEHIKVSRAQQQKEINSRWKDARQKLIDQIEKAKQDAKQKATISKIKETAKEKALDVKNKISDLQAKLKEAERQHKAELAQIEKQGSEDWKLAKQWLKSEEVSQRIARQSDIGIQAAKQMAKDIINSKTIAELRNMGGADWRHYMMLSRKSADSAERSYRKGQYEEAAKYKTQEMLNHALAMEAVKAEKEIKKLDNGLNKYVKRGQDLKNMPVEFMGQIDSLLKSYSLSDRVPVSRPGEQIPSLREFANRMQDEYHPISIPDSVLNGTPKNYSLLILDGYRDLKKSVDVIAKLGRNYNSFQSMFEKIGINEAAQEARRTIEKEVGNKYAADFLPGSQYKSKFAEKMANMTRILDKVIPSQVNALTLCRLLDGGKDNGPMQKYLYNVLAHAENDKLTMINKAKGDVQKLFAEYYGSPKEAARQRDKKIYFEHLDRYFTKEEILMIGMNWGNLGNRDRILKGFKWSEDQAKPILDTLSKKDWDFIQSTWNYLDTFWPDIQKIEFDVAGEEPKKVDPFEVVTPYGTYAGGYFPISYDPTKSSKAYKTEEQKNTLYKQSSAVHASTDQGHTQARANSNDQPIKLSMSVLFTHIDNVIHDLAFRKAVIDANRFLNNDNTKIAINNAVGMDGYRMLDKWIKSIATDQGEYLDRTDKVLRWLRNKTTFAGMGLRIAMLPTDSIGNFINGVDEIGTTRMVKAFSEYALNPIDTKNMVINNSAFMANRSMIRERDLWDISRKWYKNDSGLKNFAFQTMAWSDEIISYPLWAETYKDALGKGNTNQAAVDIADSAVKRNIGSGSILDQVGAQKGSEAKKLLSMYYSWASMMFNKMWSSGKTAGIQWGTEHKLAAIGTIARATLMLWVLPALAEFTTKEAMRNEEKTDEKKQMQRLASRFLSQPIGYVWLGRDIGQVAINQMTGQHGDYKLSPIEDTITNLSKTIPVAGKLFSDTEELQLKDAEKVSKAIVPFIGLPQQLNTWAFNFMDWINDNGEATWQDLLTRRSKK